MSVFFINYSMYIGISIRLQETSRHVQNYLFAVQVPLDVVRLNVDIAQRKLT